MTTKASDVNVTSKNDIVCGLIRVFTQLSRHPMLYGNKTKNTKVVKNDRPLSLLGVYLLCMCECYGVCKIGSLHVCVCVCLENITKLTMHAGQNVITFRLCMFLSYSPQFEGTQSDS